MRFSFLLISACSKHRSPERGIHAASAPAFQAALKRTEVRAPALFLRERILEKRSQIESLNCSAELRVCRARMVALRFRDPAASHGSILVGLLWCLALLSIVVITVLHTSRMDLLVTRNYTDRIQAHYLALAGIEHAKALIYHEVRERGRAGQHHSGQLYNAPQQFRNVPLGRGEFSIMRRGRDDEGGGVIYGISDEESRFNVNSPSLERLMKFYGMTPDVAAAIVDWIDGDDTASPNGAEVEYYASMQPPRQPRNEGIRTIRELLMVRGVSSALLLGRDTRQNGLLEPASEENEDVYLEASDVDLGWAGMMTVNSSVKNINAAGEARVNVQSADESALQTVQGISPEIARAIVSYRGENRLESVADLLDVTAPQNQSRNQLGSQNQTGVQRGSGQPQQSQPQRGGSSGPKVIDLDLLLDIADDVTTADEQDLPGLININTAGLDVLATLPEIDRDLAYAIVSYRQSSGFFANTAWLMNVPGITQEMFKQLAPLVSVRSDTYRILSEGKVNSSGIRRRIQMTVRIGQNEVATIAYREDDL